jgi:hypothetical protein
MADLLETYGKKFLGDKAWTVDLVLLLGAELAQSANKLSGLSGKEKAELVSQTILKMLDDAVKVEKGRETESTEKEKTIAHLEECKKTVLTVLPVTLTLLVAASRGKILLQKAKAEGCLSFLFGCVKKSGVLEKGVPLSKTSVIQQLAESKDRVELELRQVVVQSPESAAPPSSENKS